MKFKIGDDVTVNDLYLTEGYDRFGRDLLHKNLQGKVIKIWINTTGMCDSFGMMVENVAVVKHRYGIDSFAFKFLKLTPPPKETVAKLFD
jgi:hypothetical protein